MPPVQPEFCLVANVVFRFGMKSEVKSEVKSEDPKIGEMPDTRLIQSRASSFLSLMGRENDVGSKTGLHQKGKRKKGKETFLRRAIQTTYYFGVVFLRLTTSLAILIYFPAVSLAAIVRS